MSKLRLSFITPQELTLRDQQPHSATFDDVFFNSAGGLAESEYVFIQGNQLIPRWSTTDQNSFCVAETGFGTGLNFLATCRAWEAQTKRPNRLHYISFEQHPLSAHSMQLAHQLFPELAPFSEQLLSQWRPPRYGINQYPCPNGVTLTLFFGDVNTYLPQLFAEVDAWYLDGYAPAKNPEMWHAPLVKEMARLSKKGTSLATFTAASKVQKTLQEQGFFITKVPGFGAKREMITATYQPAVTTPNKSTQMPHWAPVNTHPNSRRQATVLGAGIAGMCVAHELKHAGYQVTVVDQNPQPMQQASGNPLAMVMPLLTTQTSPESLFHQRAFEVATQFYAAEEFQAIGVLQHLKPPQRQRWQQAIEQQQWPSHYLRMTTAGLCYENAGYVKPQLVGQRLRSSVDQWLTQQVSEVCAVKSGGWQLLNEQGKTVHTTELLVVANGIRAQQILPDQALFLSAKLGQTTTIKAPDVDLEHIILDQGYLIPDAENQHWLLGATFDHMPTEQWYQQQPPAVDHWQRNLAHWQDQSWFQQLTAAQQLESHTAIRATPPDHLPLCGPLVNQAQFILTHQDLHHGRHWQHYPEAETLPGLYLLNGLGSRGFTTAPLLAQYLVAMITSQPLPLEADLCKIIHPNRCLYRALKQPNNPYIKHD